jgi:polyribonucleotide nucleotidyltransferase
MFNIVKKSIQWGGETLEIETGKIARQADGAVIIRYAGSTVLCTICYAKKAKEGVDFFPLTAVYQEKYYAAGKIPGGFFKREARPTEKETLVSRLIDRPIRPLFVDGFFNETQVICTVIEYDGANDTDIVAIIGASAAIAISGAPFNGPVAAAKVGYRNGQYILNPKIGDKSALELVVAGTKTSVMMVESEASEITEDEMLGAVEFAHKEMQPVIDMINEFAKEAGKERFKVEVADHSEIEKKIKKLAEKPLREAYKIVKKQDRVAKVSEAKDATIAALQADLKEGEALDSRLVDGIIKKVEKDIVRSQILKDKVRIDGRTPVDIRPITCEVGLFPRVHGSAIFTRGETQVISFTTLGTADDEQMIDGLEGKYDERFMLHYNFPGFSVGEVTPIRGAGRREIGHGKLAWRALNAMIPSAEKFPYTLRIVAEVTESNGSSSMATVCSGSMSLMNAGVPIARPVAGIAMGLILEGNEYSVLSDILGDEDHLGDMDFKVAGTEKGVTSLQMDIKIQGITTEIMKIALAQAQQGRMHILGKMAEAITGANTDVADTAPKFTTIKIKKEKIREVIGSGGKVIREICEVSGAKIDIEDDGTIKVAAVTRESANKAIEMIQSIVSEPEVGTIYTDAKVVKVMDFGAVVQFLGKAQGLVHISELADQQVENVRDFVKEGDVVKVKIISIDRQGKVKLTMKEVDQQTGADKGNAKMAS